MTIKTLCKKYPALEVPVSFIKRVNSLLIRGIIKGVTETRKKEMYEDFKANISCIGLDPDEYEYCLEWFRQVMEY